MLIGLRKILLMIIDVQVVITIILLHVILLQALMQDVTTHQRINKVHQALFSEII